MATATLPESLRPLTEAQFCERLGIKQTTARNWRWKNFGPPWIKVGRLVRYDPRDVDAFLDQSKRGGNR